MSFIVPSRRVAALAVAASGLATVLSGAFAPAATAAPSTTAAPAASVVAAKASWFVDPRTPAQRKAQLAVPGKPEKYRGKLRETRAVYRTRDGALAVPMRYAFGNLVSQGQALTLDGGGLFAGGSDTLTASAKAQIAKLANSLTNASSVRCEGYADYSGSASEARSLARTRAAKVCQRLAGENPGLKVSSVSYGDNRPAIVGGAPKQRELNRRVVVEMTGTRPVTPTPPTPPAPPAPQAKVPGAPVLVHADGIGGGVRYGFNAPASDGGSPITGYQVSAGGSWAPVQLLLPREAAACKGCGPQAQFEALLDDVNAADMVNVRVRAVNKVGAGAPSNTLGTTVYDVPSAPRGLEVDGDDGVITTSFGAPESDGGSPVSLYEISYDGGQSWSLAPVIGDGPWTVTKEGLANGTTYDVRVRAWNTWGYGPEAVKNNVLVATVPSAPWLDDPDPVGSTIDFAVEVPESNGGTPITGYEITTDGGETWEELSFDDEDGMTFSLGLVYGHEYVVRVRAVNARGKGASSKPRTVVATAVPSAPRIQSATGDDGVITTVVEPAEKDNGSAITSYEISYDGGDTFSAIDTSGPAPWTTVKSGFVNGTEYGVLVRAVNGKGAGSTYGALVLVAAAPAKVVLDEPTVTGTHAAFTFAVPADNGSAITSYEVTTDDGESWGPVTTHAVGQDRGFDLDDLVLGQQYLVRVRAINAKGTGAASARRAVTPIAAPDAPADVVATATGTTVKVTFTAPVSTGARPVVGYQVSIDGSADWADVELVDGAFTLTDQVVGTHTYAVRAVNEAGQSNATTSNEVEIKAAPKPPQVTGYTNTRDVLTIHFNEGDVNLDDVVSWQVTVDGGAWTDFSSVETPWFGGLTGKISPYPCGGQACSDVLGSVQVRASLVGGGYSDVSNVYYLPGYESDPGGIPG